MKTETLKEYVYCGFDIEFDYKGRRFSITIPDEGLEYCISFCEYYQEPIDVKTFDELLNIEYKGEILADI